MSLEVIVGIAALFATVIAVFVEVRRAAREAVEREAERIRGAAHLLAQGARLQAVRLNSGEALLSAPHHVIAALRARLPEEVETVDELRSYLTENSWVADVVTAEGWMRSPLTRQVVDEMQRLLDPARDMAGGWSFASVLIQRLATLATGTSETDATQPGTLPGSLDPWDNPMAKLPWILKAQLDPSLDVFDSDEPSEQINDDFFKRLELRMGRIAAGAHRTRSRQSVEQIAFLLASTAAQIDTIDARRVVAIARDRPQAQGPGSAKERIEICEPILKRRGEQDLGALVKTTAKVLDEISRGDRDITL